MTLARLPCRAREPRCRLAQRASARDGYCAIRCGRLVGHRIHHVLARQRLACARDARRACLRLLKPGELGSSEPCRQSDASGDRCGPPTGASRHDVGGQPGRVPDLVRRRWMARDRLDRSSRWRSAAAQTIGAACWTPFVLALSVRRRPLCRARGRCPVAGAGSHAHRSDHDAPTLCDGLSPDLPSCVAARGVGTACCARAAHGTIGGRLSVFRRMCAGRARVLGRREQASRGGTLLSSRAGAGSTC